jgi:TRAP-type mannitol/chloroaromatic compound transport system permease large subunit
MIPPSLVLVFYGLTTSTSIGDRFLASTVPGVVLALIYVAYVLARCAIDPKLGPRRRGSCATSRWQRSWQP